MHNIGLLVFIAFLDNMSQQPIISPFAVSLGASPLLAGLAVGIFSIANISGNLWSPLLIRKFGLRKTLTLAFTMVAMALLLYGLIQSSWQLLAVRILHGITAGIVVPSIFTLLSYETNTGIRMGQAGRIIGLTAILGPPFATAVSSNIGFRWVFTILALLFMVGSIATRYLPHLTQGSERTTDFRGILRVPGLRIAYVSAFGLMFATGMLSFWFPLQLMAADIPLMFVGVMFSIFGTSAIVIMKYAGIKGESNPVLVICQGFGLLVAGLLFMSGTTNLWVVAWAMGLYGLGFGQIFPAMNLLLIQQTASTNRASAFAVFHGFFSTGVFVAPLVGGLTYQHVHPFQLVSSFVVCSTLVLCKPGLNLIKKGIAKEQGR